MENQQSGFLPAMLRNLRDMRMRMTDPAGPGEKSDKGKRQTVFEYEAVMMIRKELPAGMGLDAEGYEYFGPEDAEFILALDPTDGTAGDARSLGAGVKNGLPVTAVMVIRENVPNSTFASVKYAGVLDLRHGEIFTAGSDGAWRGDQNLGESLKAVSQYNVHAPAVTTEIARRANSFFRFLIPYGLYPEVFADSNSSALVMLWALQGYCDLWWNSNLPGISGAGQRGHELGAMAVFARAMGACALQTRIEGNQVVIAGSLDDAPYTFDGQTSVILGPDRKVVDHYLGLVNASLSRKVSFGPIGGELCLAEVLAELNRQCPNERWGLPLVKE